MKISNRSYIKVMVVSLLVGLLLVMPISYADSKGKQWQGLKLAAPIY